MLPVVGPAHSSSAATTIPAPAGTSSTLAVAQQASSGGGRSWLTIAGAVVLGLLAFALAGFLTVTRRGRTP
jgi:hypothetical protein